MTRAERHLSWFLRFSALMFLAAVPAVVMPTDWMNTIAEMQGLAKLPDLPLVGYLARHLSALYAAMGASYWYLSCDVGRYLPLLRFSVPLTVVQSVVILAIDVGVEMPMMWTVGEAVAMFGWTVAFWWLVRRVGHEPRP
jgi:hypothetical protein